MTTSHRTTSTNSTPEPGSRVFIKSGDFGGEVGTVGSIVVPASAARAGRTLPIIFEPAAIFDGVHVIAAYVEPGNVQPVPTELEDAPNEFESVDPWAPRIANWLTTQRGEAALTNGLTTGEIIDDALEVHDGFTQQVRVAGIMRALGYEKVERSIGNSRVWHWVAVTGRVQADTSACRQAVFGDSAGLVVALCGLISWLLDKSANVDRLAQLARAILGAPQVVLNARDVAYFEWVRAGVSWLGKLQTELRVQQISQVGDMLAIIIAGHVSGQLGAAHADVMEFHRSIVQILVAGARQREGFDMSDYITDDEDRPAAVNGWIEALVLMAETSHRMEFEVREGRGVPAGANKDEMAADFARQAAALKWIVDAVGGVPRESEKQEPPMLDLASFVDMALASMPKKRCADTERCPAPESEAS